MAVWSAHRPDDSWERAVPSDDARTLPRELETPNMVGNPYMSRADEPPSMATTDIRFEAGTKLYIIGTTVWFLAVGLASLLLILIGNGWF